MNDNTHSMNSLPPLSPLSLAFASQRDARKLPEVDHALVVHLWKASPSIL